MAQARIGRVRLRLWLILLLGCGGSIGAAGGPGPDLARDPSTDGGAAASDDGSDGAAAPDLDGFVVAEDGDDANPGTIALPFRTLGHCAQTVAAGQTCLVRAGTYRETVVPPRSGQASAPITFRAYPGEHPVISGADPVATGWTAQGAHVFVAPVGPKPAAVAREQQLFVDGVMAIEARWPNLASGAASLLDHDAEAVAGAGTSTSSTGGVIAASGLPAGAWAGATIHVRGGYNWGAHSGIVSSVSGGQISYTATSHGYASYASSLGPQPGSRFYLSGVASALDSAWEWVIRDGQLALWVPTGTTADAHIIELKTRDLAFDLRGRSYIALEGLALFGATVATDASSSNIRLNRLSVKYPSHLVAVPDPWGSLTMDTGIVLDGHDNVLAESEISFSACNGVSVLGARQTITGNRIFDSDYAAIYCGPIHLRANTAGHQITHNTIRRAGRDGIVLVQGCGAGGADNTLTNVRIAFNDVSAFGMLNQDTGGVYVSECENGSGTHIDHNWFHDATVKSSRGFGVGGSAAASGVGIYLDIQSHGFNVHHNVVWNNAGAGIQLNGYAAGGGGTGPARDNTINNNTCAGGQDRSLMSYGLEAGALAGTYISNNIFLGGADPCDGNGYCRVDGAGGYHNWTGDPGFVDAAHADFHLAAGSPALDTAQTIWTDTFPVDNVLVPVDKPDYGAYERNGLSWVPGAQ